MADEEPKGDLLDNENDDEDARQRKRKERLEQNRISARESRKRKKTMIEELQRTVITLSRENKDLNERNEILRRQLMEIASQVRSRCSVRGLLTSQSVISYISCALQYPNIVPLQAIMGQTPAPIAPQSTTAAADLNNAVLGAMAQVATETAGSTEATDTTATTTTATTLNTMSWLANPQPTETKPTETSAAADGGTHTSVSKEES